MDLGPPFAHVVLDVEDKRLLAKVSVNDLTRSLKANSWVQVGLEEMTDQACLNFKYLNSLNIYRCVLAYYYSINFHESCMILKQ